MPRGRLEGQSKLIKWRKIHRGRKNKISFIILSADSTRLGDEIVKFVKMEAEPKMSDENDIGSDDVNKFDVSKAEDVEQ